MTQFTLESDQSVILIVDNNPTALFMKSHLLSRQGYQIIEASNGADALTMATAELPDLLLLDVNLPHINGFDVCRQLKTQPETQFIKVLQTSAARVNAPDRVRSLEVGADAYLVEPAEEEELIGTVRALLKLARHERDNQRLIERLTESEMRYRSLVERMPAAMYTIDRNGHITFYNDQAVELWGRRPKLGDREDRFSGSNTLLWPDGTPLPHDKTPMVDAVQDGTALHGQEIIIERSDGTRRHVIVHIDPLRNTEGHIVGAVNLFTDITARKQAEDALRDAERRSRTIFEQAGVGVAQIDSRTGRFERVNRKYCEIVGRTEAEMLATTFMKITHPDDLAEDLAGMEHLRCGRVDSFAVEKRYLRKDGSIVWVLLNVAPLRKPGEELSHHIAVVQDITERKRAESALRESETRFKTLADSAPVLMWMNDQEGARFVNRAYLEFLGVNDQFVVGKYNWAAFVHPEDRHRHLQAYLSAFEKHTLFDEQFRFRRHDGGYRWMRSVGQPRHSANGELLGYVGATYDITEIKEAQERLERWSVELEHAVNIKTAELQQSQERLRALTSELNLAEQRERKRLATELHDHLQQMLVVGKLTIGQGRRGTSGVPACETVLKKVDDILSDALTYSRTLVAELSPPVLRDHGLTASLKWLAEYMKKKHEQAVTVVVPDDQGLSLPEDQRVLLFQSVRELLINSAKHAGTGQATLTMEKRADHLCITVKDEGTGFDLAAVAAEARVPSGEISSKFGLYSIQERMRALGGSFNINSAPRHGTMAMLILPLVRSAEDNQLHLPVTEFENACATVHADEADSLTKGRMMVSVLLVDDHAMVRQGLRSVLDAYADIQVVGEARDGMEAVKLVEKLRPRVVVMDINMPKMNGIEATRQIKTKWPETTTIGISVNIGDDNSNAMRRAGAATLLTKEAAVEQLYHTIIQEVGAHSG
ncbi:MAG: PAS domain S-box protein [Nitrospira sp.]|nr:PAS domain S-box protein [Nitrospira sp.]